MNKKFFNYKISTIITIVLCLIAAVLFWLFVKYCDEYGLNNASALASMLSGQA